MDSTLWHCKIHVNIRVDLLQRPSNESVVVDNGDFRFSQLLYLQNFHRQCQNYCIVTCRVPHWLLIETEIDYLE